MSGTARLSNEERDLWGRLYLAAEALVAKCDCFSPERTAVCNALEEIELYEENRLV